MNHPLMVVVFALAISTTLAADAPSTLAPTSGDATLCDYDKKGDYEFKTNIRNRWCESDNGTVMECEQSCCKKTDKCKHKTATIVCQDDTPTTTYINNDNAKAEVAWTHKTEQTACCSVQKTCGTAGFTCPTNWVDKAGKATINCAKNVCTKDVCCNIQTLTCKGFKDAASGGTAEEKKKWNIECPLGRLYDTTKDAVAVGGLGAWVGICCTKYAATCLGEKYRRAEDAVAFTTLDTWNCNEDHFLPAKDALIWKPDGTKEGKTNQCCAAGLTDATVAPASVTEASWHTTCCKPKLKCSKYVCDTTKGLIADHGKDGQYCVHEAGDFAGAGIACEKVCCKADKNKCRGFTMPANEHKEWGCYPDDRFFKNVGPFKVYDEDGKQLRDENGYFIMRLGAKANNIVQSQDTYKSQCCSRRWSCEEFKDPTLRQPEAQASGANYQRSLVTAPTILSVAFALSN